MLKYAAYTLIGFLALNLSSLQAATLCEQKSLLKNAKAYQELVIPESEFNPKAVAKAFEHFNQTLPALIESTKKTKKLRENPMYYIKTPKSATILQGYQLLQNYRIALLKAKLAEAKDKKTKKALKAVAASKNKFCDFYEMNMLGAD